MGTAPETDAGKMLESQAVMLLIELGVARGAARTFIRQNVMPARPVTPLIIETVRSLLASPTKEKADSTDLLLEVQDFIGHHQAALRFYIDGPADAAAAAGGAVVGAAIGTAVAGPLGTLVGGLIGGLAGGGADNALSAIISAATENASDTEKFAVANLQIFIAMMNANKNSLAGTKTSNASTSTKEKAAMISAGQATMMKSVMKK